MSQLKAMFLICQLGLILTSCGISINVASTLDDRGTVASNPSSTATIDLLFPDYHSKGFGYLKWFYGDCSEEGNSVAVSTGGTQVGTGTCTGGKFSIYVDTTAIAVGDHVFTLSHSDSNGLPKTTTITLNKWTSACDTLVNRQKNFGAGLAGGSNTYTDPRIICTPEQARAPDGNWSAYFAMGNDIYFSHGDTDGDFDDDGSDQDYVTGAGWAPIVSGGYQGTFFGKGMAIEGLRINRPTTNCIGFFCGSWGGSIMGLRFYDANIVGQDNTAIVLGNTDQMSHVSDIRIVNLRSTNTVTGRNYVGGVVGNTFRSGYYDLLVEGQISGASGVGGIIGQVVHRVSLSVFRMVGSVTASGNYAGGIIGQSAQELEILNGYASATVSSANYSGGIVGYLSSTSSRIYNVYNSGDITATGNYAGGIASRILGSSYLENAYNSGNVSGASAANRVGMIIGEDGGVTLNNVFYSSGATCTNSLGTCTAFGTSVASSNFLSSAHAAFTTWDWVENTSDYDDIWKMTASGPRLYFDEEETSYSVPFSGSGTSAEPYQLTADGESLFRIGSNPRYSNKHFIMTSDMNLTPVLSGFKPLFRHGIFTGQFDGDLYTISGLEYAEPRLYGSGLFARAAGARIIDLRVDVTGVISGPFNVGGLVGITYGDGIISNVLMINSSGEINAVGGPAGGLVGRNSFTVSRVSNTNKVRSTTDDVGGIIGAHNYKTLSDCFNTSVVEGVNNVGGIVGGGYSPNVPIRRCYNIGSVTASSQNVGGVVGSHSSPGNVTHNFSTGDVVGNSATATVGLLRGSTNALGATNYYLATSACTNSGGGGCNADGGSQADYTDFYLPSNAPLTSWDFTNIWQDNSALLNLPTLRD